jgi:hypothetical protein
MDDLKWLAVIVVMSLLGLLYIRLLGDGGEEAGS